MNSLAGKFQKSITRPFPKGECFAPHLCFLLKQSARGRNLGLGSCYGAKHSPLPLTFQLTSGRKFDLQRKLRRLSELHPTNDRKQILIFQFDYFLLRLIAFRICNQTEKWFTLDTGISHKVIFFRGPKNSNFS